MNEVKYKSISLTLENNIKNNIYSDKLPPVRSLSAEFKVSTRTMNKALKTLVQKGLIIPSGPKGNIISKKSVIRAKTNIVAIFHGIASLNPDEFPIFRELKLKVEADGYKTLFVSVLDPNIFDDKNFWSSILVDGYIFAYSSIKKELAYNLHHNSVPFVVGNHLPPECGAHWVDFNIKKTLRTLVQAFINAGHKRILFAFSKIGLPSYVDYVEQVWKNIQKEYFKEYSGDILHLAEDDTDKNNLKCVKKFTELQADALILLGFSPLVIESELAAMRLQINEDYSLAYISKQVESQSDKFSYALASYKTLADEIWNLFKKVIETPEIEAQNILVDENIHLNKKLIRRIQFNEEPAVHSDKYVLAEV